MCFTQPSVLLGGALGCLKDTLNGVFRWGLSYRGVYVVTSLMRRCQSEGFAPAGYFDEAVSCGFNSPEPITPHHEFGFTDEELHLLQQKIIPGDVGVEASRAILKASRVTGVITVWPT